MIYFHKINEQVDLSVNQNKISSDILANQSNKYDLTQARMLEINFFLETSIVTSNI